MNHPKPDAQTPKSECKLINSTSTPSRFRPNSRAKDSPKRENGNFVLSLSPALKARAASEPPHGKTNTSTKSTRSSLVLNKPKSPEEVLASQNLDQVKVFGRYGNCPTVEQFPRPRRQRIAEANSGKNDEALVDKMKRELEEKLNFSDNMVKDLQAEVLALKIELDKAHSLNAELEKQNKKLANDVVAAEAKIASLSSHEQKEPIKEYQSPKFKDIQKLIANKLENSIIRKEAINEACNVKPPPSVSISTRLISKAADSESRAPAYPSMPAPPPPPPPPRLPARAAAARKPPSPTQFYHSLTKPQGQKDPLGPVSHNKPAVLSAHSSIVGEIQNRSAHLLAIRADIETKGDFINSLIQKVLAAAYTDIDDVLKFVDWLDGELSSLADERAVLKHFKWPERKADAMREAAVEYQELKLLESEISSYKDDPSIPCGAALKKMASLLDKSERSIQKLIKLRNSVMRSYQDCRIPVDWMLDSGKVAKIKQASMKLAQMYMKRVTKEHELVRNSDRESTQEALLLQGVHFAYRAHQFAGGLDSETLCAFEEIRQRVPGQLGGSRELLAGIPSS